MNASEVVYGYDAYWLKHNSRGQTEDLRREGGRQLEQFSTGKPRLDSDSEQPTNLEDPQQTGKGQV